MSFDVNHLQFVDYIAVAGTLLFSIAIGFYYGYFGEQTKEEMLVGGRNMGIWPIALSMVVSYFSAITIQGYPAEVYSYGIQIFNMTLVNLIYVPLSIVIYTKVFYPMKLTSIYEYFETRFDSGAIRCLASVIYIIQVLMVNAIILYTPSLALETIVGFPTWLSIMGIGLIGTIYTAVGGIKAVVWTDVFQFVMIMVGLFAIVTKGFISAGGVEEAFKIASDKGRLVLFDWSIDIFERHNLFNFVFGYGFYCMFWFGTHQQFVQRYSSLPTFSAATKALLLTIPLNLLIMTVVLFTGISVTATYAGCCPVLLGEISKEDALIPYFVIKELVVIPGMMGIFVSCIFSGVLSSISSSLNALAAVTLEDFILRADLFNMKAAAQAHCAKILVVIYGILSISLAFGVGYLGAIYPLLMKVVGAAGGPVGGIFLCALFMPFMNKHGATIGMLIGMIATMYIAAQSFFLGKDYVLDPKLPTSLEECPPETNFALAKSYVEPAELPDFDYPTKLYTISYLLYPIVGAIISVIFAVPISLMTGGLSDCNLKKTI